MFRHKVLLTPFFFLIQELRKKNWKVMEALNAAENRNKKQTAISLEVSLHMYI